MGESQQLPSGYRCSSATRTKNAGLVCAVTKPRPQGVIARERQPASRGAAHGSLNTNATTHTLHVAAAAAAVAAATTATPKKDGEQQAQSHWQLTSATHHHTIPIKMTTTRPYKTRKPSIPPTISVLDPCCRCSHHITRTCHTIPFDISHRRRTRTCTLFPAK